MIHLFKHVSNWGTGTRRTVLTPCVKDAERNQANTCSREQAGFNLLAELDPESLCVGVVKVDNFDEEDDNAGTPEHCTYEVSDLPRGGGII